MQQSRRRTHRSVRSNRFSRCSWYHAQEGGYRFGNKRGQMMQRKVRGSKRFVFSHMPQERSIAGWVMNTQSLSHWNWWPHFLWELANGTWYLWITNVGNNDQQQVLHTAIGPAPKSWWCHSLYRANVWWLWESSDAQCITCWRKQDNTRRN